MQKGEIWVSKANNGYDAVLLSERPDLNEYQIRPAWTCTYLYNITGGYELHNFDYSSRSILDPIVDGFKTIVEGFNPKKRGNEYAIKTMSIPILDMYNDGQGLIFEDSLIENYEKVEGAVIVGVPPASPITYSSPAQVSLSDTVQWTTLEELRGNSK